MIIRSGALVGATGGWLCKSCRTKARVLSRSKRREYASAPQFRKPSQRLPSSPARTRFAPSPTGFMHLGSLRTALFNFLLAKATGGQFLLRIEDTDKKRTVPGAEERICRDLEWAGLHWDEGPEIGGQYGPYRQSERTELYRKHAEDLIASGHAYRCFCSPERLNELAKARSQLGLPTDYDRTCEGIPEEEANNRVEKGCTYIIRLRVPDAYPKYEDLVYGRVGGLKRKAKIIHGEQSYEDPVLIKSDGQPTYHLANVVDDHYMKITHVVRAVEWMPSTPKHLALYEAFDWQPPLFAHVGLLQDPSYQKLSKRNLDVDIDSFRKRGIFPEALINHVALLGWSHSESSDFLPLERLIDIFDLRFTKGNTIVNFQKLDHLQKLYAQRFIVQGGERFDTMVDEVLSVVRTQQSPETSFNFASEAEERSYVEALLRADAKQYTSAVDFYSRAKGLFTHLTVSEKTPIPQDLDHLDCRRVLETFEQVPEVNWSNDMLQSTQRELTKQVVADQQKLRTQSTDTTRSADSIHSVEKVGTQISRYLRWAIMNSQPGPPIALAMELLGRRETLSRLRSSLVQAEATK